MATASERAVTPDQIERIHQVTDSFGLFRDAVVVPLVGAEPGQEKEMLLPDGKLLVRPPYGKAFSAWHAGFAERLAALDLRKVPRGPK